MKLNLDTIAVALGSVIGACVLLIAFLAAFAPLIGFGAILIAAAYWIWSHA